VLDELGVPTAQADGALSVARRCQVLALSRAAYYCQRTGWLGPAPDVERHDPIQYLALECPAYDERRMTTALWRRGWAVPPKHVLRLMRADNLRCRRRRGVVRTT
jgi:putative transposase